jgi:predicted RNase H-like HicB family nuclease
MEACYYSLIRQTREGEFVGWVPDLPGVMASGSTDDIVLRQLSADARTLLHKIAGRGLRRPSCSPADAFPLGDRNGPYRRILLVLS